MRQGVLLAIVLAVLALAVVVAVSIVAGEFARVAESLR